MAKTTRTGKSLIEIQSELGTEAQCIEFLKSIRWPEGVRCVKCDHDRVSEFDVEESTRQRTNSKGVVETKVVPARHLFQCLDAKCGHQFSVTAGTIFNDSHLPLTKWMMAVAIMCNAKKGVSAKQLQRDLATSYKTAWYLSHRIREAMELGNWNDEKMTGTVEMDETYVGGKFNSRVQRAKYDKPAVFGIVERETGRVHARHVERATRKTITAEIDEFVGPTARVMTDESRLYENLTERGFNHQTVIHSTKEWVRGDVHTQSIEGFWGLLKRGVIGTFHQVSVKHLDRYVQEFSYRFNGRKNQELFTLTVAALTLGIPLPYDELVGAKEERLVRNKKGVNAPKA